MCNNKQSNVQIGASYPQRKEVTEYCCSYLLLRYKQITPSNN